MLPKSFFKAGNIVTRTPMRITLAGGGTDVLWYSRIRGGAWISASINKYVYVVLKKSPYLNKIKLTGKDTISAKDIIRECLTMTGIKRGIEIGIYSDVLPKSGLGGSGSLEVGLLHALYAYNNKVISIEKLAQRATAIEIERLDKSVGPQDQYIAAYGGIKYFEIDRNGKVDIQHLAINKIALSKLKKNLIFFSTKLQHDTAKILSDEKKAAKYKNSSAVIKTLDEIKKIGMGARENLLSGNMDMFGKSLHFHWLAKKKLSKKVSSARINKWYNKAIKIGSLGGKIMGSGGGGWFVFYVNKNHKYFIGEMEKLGLKNEKVDFCQKGSEIIWKN